MRDSVRLEGPGETETGYRQTPSRQTSAQIPLSFLCPRCPVRCHAPAVRPSFLMSLFATRFARLAPAFRKMLEDIQLTEAIDVRKFVQDVGTITETFQLLTEGQAEEGMYESFVLLVAASQSESDRQLAARASFSVGQALVAVE